MSIKINLLHMIEDLQALVQSAEDFDNLGGEVDAERVTKGLQISQVQSRQMVFLTNSILEYRKKGEFHVLQEKDYR